MSARTLWLYILSALLLIAGVVIFFKASELDPTVAAVAPVTPYGLTVPTGERVANFPLVMQKLTALWGGSVFCIIGAIGLVGALICHTLENRRED